MPSLAKELMMKELEQQFQHSSCTFISSFQGLSVADISDFRRAIEKVAPRSIVIKHSMAKKIFIQRALPDAEKLLKGQVLVTFGEGEPQNVSKSIVAFAKGNNKLVPSGVIFENKVYGADFVKRLAVMPSRHELLTQVAVRVKSPISGLVLTLAQLTRGLVIAINEVKKKKELQAA